MDGHLPIGRLSALSYYTFRFKIIATTDKDDRNELYNISNIVNERQLKLQHHIW